MGKADQIILLKQMLADEKAAWADDATLAEGYMGHDEFAIVENSLARRFPIYAAGDSNAAPSGKMRQVSYGLVAGEAGWLLRMRDVTEF